MNQPLNCTHCPRRDGCISLCRSMERQLPREEHARLHGLHRAGQGAAWLQRLKEQRERVAMLLDWRHELRGRMREVVQMTYNDGLSQGEIARRLGIGERAVGQYLARAHAYALRRAWGRK